METTKSQEVSSIGVYVIASAMPLGISCILSINEALKEILRSGMDVIFFVILAPICILFIMQILIGISILSFKPWSRYTIFGLSVPGIFLCPIFLMAFGQGAEKTLSQKILLWGIFLSLINYFILIFAGLLGRFTQVKKPSGS